ncbi:MAG: ribosome recycling factor [bacterium]|jgi:ribosome recycling factor
MSTIAEIKSEAESKMIKSVEATREELAHLRAGRANPALLDRVMVEAYETKSPLRQLATVSAPDASTLNVQPFDPHTLKNIERAIMQSDLGLTPQSDGRIIRISIPQLTEERRKELIKVASRIAEEGRVALRNIRRDAIDHNKRLEKAKEVSEDELKRANEEIEKIIEKHLKEIDELYSQKAKEIQEF